MSSRSWSHTVLYSADLLTSQISNATTVGTRKWQQAIITCTRSDERLDPSYVSFLRVVRLSITQHRYVDLSFGSCCPLLRFTNCVTSSITSTLAELHAITPTYIFSRHPLLPKERGDGGVTDGRTINTTTNHSSLR
eukprot:1035632-Prorocentrum_minimum.AAC.2